jgi:hypothetical protein
MTTMAGRRWGVAVPLLALAGLTACTVSPPPPTPTATPPPASHTGRAAPAATLAAVDPCTLIDAVDQRLTQDPPDPAEGPHSCTWTRLNDQSGHGGYVLGIHIWNDTGLTGVPTAGFTVTDTHIGRRQAKQAVDPVSGYLCLVAIAVTESSRVDVTVSSVPPQPEQTCSVAAGFAEQIEPRLPTPQ